MAKMANLTTFTKLATSNGNGSGRNGSTNGSKHSSSMNNSKKMLRRTHTGLAHVVIINSRKVFFLMLGVLIFQATMIVFTGLLSSVLDTGSVLGPVETLLFANCWDGCTKVSYDDTMSMEDHIIKQVERQLDVMEKGDANLTTALMNDRPQGRSLDDYYHRAHIQSNNSSKKSILIVGGLDGSGTRSFVDTLKRLEVAMLLDDIHTLDIHAQVLFDGQGWPPLVRMVLNETHSANYDFADLSPSTQAQAKHEMHKFQFAYDHNADMFLQRAAQSNKTLAENVKYGFKAPASMLLLPLLLEQYESVKFVHVVRDGRDVALSRNKSPVHKFYDIFYGIDNNSTQSVNQPMTDEEKEMRLWNDWNIQVSQWAKAHNDGHTFDYLVMRTEDLLDPERKYASLMQLADFVGSPKTPKDICCQSRRAVVDMGLSPITTNDMKKEEPTTLKSTEGVVAALVKNLKNDPNTFTVPNPAYVQLQNIRLRNPELYKRLKETEHRRQEGQEDERTRHYQNITDRILQSRHKTTNTSETDTEKALRLWIAKGRKLSELVTVPEANNITTTTLQNAEKNMTAAEIEVERKRQAIIDERLSKIQNEQRREQVRVLYLRGAKVSNSAAIQNKRHNVHIRYGKWVAALEKQPELSAKLHKIGAPALEAFGYEPARLFQDRMNYGFRCDENVKC